MPLLIGDYIMRNLSSKHWVCTINNYNDENIDHIKTAFSNDFLDYYVVGKEVGVEGTRHLQCYFHCDRRRTMKSLKDNLHCNHMHCEVTRGTAKQASDYCKKDKNFLEDGTLPDDVRPGERLDLNAGLKWLSESRRNDREILEHPMFGRFWVQYPRFVDAARRLAPHVKLIADMDNVVLRPFQKLIVDSLAHDPGDRVINFYVDNRGNTGKTWITRYVYSLYPERVQLLESGRATDISFAVDESKSIFVFSVPRGGMEFMSYRILEGLKDKQMFASKYDSHMKMWIENNHVIVLCNEQPDMSKLTIDRYNIIDI